MATGKKSFTAYCDWKETFETLPDEKAGQLIKHIFSYVNDEDPKSDDILINAVFAQIKATLKRDLEKWQNKKLERSKSGVLGNLKRYNLDLYERVISNEIDVLEAQKIAKDRIAIHSNTKLAVRDSVSVSVSDSDILLKKETKDIIKSKKFNFKNSLIEIGVDKKIVSEWLLVRKQKKLVNTETAFKKILKEIEKSEITANEAIKISVENSWGGYKQSWLKNISTKKNESGTYKGNR